MGHKIYKNRHLLLKIVLFHGTYVLSLKKFRFLFIYSNFDYIHHAAQVHAAMQVEKNICSKGPFIIDINQEGGEERGSLGMGREVVKEKIASTEKTKTNKKQLKKTFLSTRKNINLIACIVCLIIR